MTDDQFGRQTVAGINPLSIERLKVFPPVSKLEPSIYGPQESALKEEHIRDQLNGMSIQQVYIYDWVIINKIEDRSIILGNI